MKKFFITTPIYYVNDLPHIGHAYTTVAADVLARFYRNLGHKVYFLTGTDEHGVKIELAAKRKGVSTKKFTDTVADSYKDNWRVLNISNDYFIRTTDANHKKEVGNFLNILYKKGVIYKGIYEGLYCVGHEKFLTGDEIVAGKCPEHHTKPVPYRELNYFFKLSSFQKELTKIISGGEIEITPTKRKNEVLGKLKQGLEDISISRESLHWGIPLPFDKSQTTYVWVDALINYLTYGKEQKVWPADLHLIGKDILWFHAVIWPALLLAVGYELPKKIFAHGFFTIEGEKMSKSLDNVISPKDLVARFGVDGTRFLLLSIFTFGEDGNISLKLFKEKYNKELANGLGNTVSRITKLASTTTLILPKSGKNNFDPKFVEVIESLSFEKALKIPFNLLASLNSDIDKDKPWNLKGRGLKKVLETYIEKLLLIATYLEPFMPETSQKIKKQFSSSKIKSILPIFPRQ